MQNYLLSCMLLFGQICLIVTNASAQNILLFEDFETVDFARKDGNLNTSLQSLEIVLPAGKQNSVVLDIQ